MMLDSSSIVAIVVLFIPCMAPNKQQTHCIYRIMTFKLMFFVILMKVNVRHTRNSKN